LRSAADFTRIARINANYCQHIKVEFIADLANSKCEKVADKRRNKSEAEVLDHATDNTLRALKQDMLKKDGRVDIAKLRKEGYSERLLAKLEHS